MNPFDFVKEIQFEKQNIITDRQSEKDYKPFPINRALSYEMDCLMQANEMNQRYHLDNKLQFDYLMVSIRARRRPAHKWGKRENSDDISSIKILFEYSNKKAQEALRILTSEQIDVIKILTSEGG